MGVRGRREAIGEQNVHARLDLVVEVRLETMLRDVVDGVGIQRVQLAALIGRQLGTR